MFGKKPKPQNPQRESTARRDYAAHKERARARQSAQSKTGRDIGELPAVADPKRRAKALESLRAFYETYFPATFSLPWSDAHLQSIADTERAILNAEQFAEAMPRGWGKSSRFERAALWAGLKGVRKFCYIVGSDKGAALDMLTGIKTELESNELLAADFPEVCYPIAKLQRITQNARGQTYLGKPTYIAWAKDTIVLPTIPGSPASGFIMRVTGILGRRGAKYTRADGKTARPDLLLLDDPQTDQSAANPIQCEKRARLINGALLRMVGPDERMAAIAAVTIICPDDLAARLIDRSKAPHWHGRRYQTVLEFPRDARGKFDPDWWAEWQKYAEARADGMRADDGGAAARAHYLKRRKVLDAGVVVGWEHKIEKGDVSAVQSAMNWLLDAPESFWAEGQNDPQPPEQADSSFDADALWAKLLPIPAGAAPAPSKLVTAFVDVQKPYLPWMVSAWQEGYRGHVMAYGAWPDQGEPYFQRRSAKKTIARIKPGASRREQLYHALGEVVKELLARAWPIEHEGEATQELPIDLMLIDAGNETDVVVDFIREMRNPRLMPSRGEGLKPSDVPMTERKPKEGQQIGHHWMIHVPQKRAIRHVFIDTNRWKTIVAEGLAADKGAPNTITIHAGTRARHRVLLDQLTAEYPEPTEARGRTLDQWKCRPNRENDLWDCLVGCAVAASVRGLSAAGHAPPPRKGRRRRATGSWAKEAA